MQKRKSYVIKSTYGDKQNLGLVLEGETPKLGTKFSMFYTKEGIHVRFECEIGGRTVVVETGKYGGQANGSCLVRSGETVVMVNATMAETPREGMDFFPLSVD